MKLNNESQIFLGILLIITSSVIIWYTMREKVYCGTVTNKINGIEYNKHSTSPDPILIVKYDFNQKKKEIHVNWITYTEAQVNGRICFNQMIKEMEPTWIDPGLLGLIGCFTFAIGVVFILNGIVAFDFSRSE